MGANMMGCQGGIVLGALAVLAVLLVALPVLGAVHAPKVVSEHTPDLHSLDDFVKSVLRPGMTQKEKAEALWRATARQMYHWNDPQEEPCTEPGKYTDVTDPIRLMNVYGYTLCFVSAGAMEAIWRAGGLEAREFGIPGHVACEVWYDGAYHYQDVEFKGFYPAGDGSVAGIEQLGLRPAELMVKARLPEDFFPYSRRPWRTYMSKMVYAGIADEGPSWYGSHRARKGHVMNVSLRKGETYYRSWDNVGRYICDYERWTGGRDFGPLDCRRGPNNMVSDRTFGNGILIYEPDLTSETDEYEDGVFAAEGVVKTKAGLTCAGNAAQGHAVFRFALPYIIAGDPGKVEVPDDTTKAAMLALAGSGEVAVETSTDEGRTWQGVPIKGFGTVDLSRLVERRYAYLLKFVLAKGATLKAFRAETSFQLAQASLPALKRGINRMAFSLGADPYQVMTYDPPVWQSEEAFRAAVHSSENIKWDKSWSKAVSTAQPNEPGYLVYELKAPPGKRLRKIAVDLGGHLRWQQWHEDYVHLSVAENEPKGFRRIGTLRGAPYSEHWHRRLYREVAFPREKDVSTAYVRLDILSKQRAGMSECRFTIYFENEKPDTFGDTKRTSSCPRGLLVTHGWIEDGKVKTHAQTVRKRSENYTVRTGPGFQRPLFICMEVVGKAGSRASSDPLHLADYKARPDSFYPEAAAGLSHAEVLSRLDREGLEQSDTMVEVLLRGKNRTLANEVAKMVGYRPVEAIRGFLEERVKKDPEDFRARRGLALLDERKAPSRAAFLRTYLPALEPDEYGLRFIRKIGQTGTPEDIPLLLERVEKAGDLQLKLALVQAALALGDRSALPQAAALLNQTKDPWQCVPLDAFLINQPAYRAEAKDRMLRLMESPHQHQRWGLLKEVAEHAGGGRDSWADQVAARAFRDTNPWIRLRGLTILWKLRAGKRLVTDALKTEEVPFLAEAYRDFLEQVE